jgi:hypothetical protein
VDLQLGQLNGDYLVYVYWDRSERSQVRLGDVTDWFPDWFDVDGWAWAPSVRNDGTVYSIVTGWRCGLRPRLMRLSGKPTLIARLPDGTDGSQTYSYVDGGGVERVLYQVDDCDHPLGSDVYRAVDMQTLTILKEGLGSGTVTSEPAGISCGDACSASFLGATTVRLTAEPDLGSRFERWGYPCRTSNTVCEIPVDRAEQVKAFFEPIVSP